MIGTPQQIAELAEDPNLEAIYAGQIISEQVLFCVYDHDKFYKSITMEPGDDVLVTKHRDGTYFMHFMSAITKYHYKAPWISDDQVTHDEGALYHV